PFYSLPLTFLAIMIIPGLLGGALGYLIFRNRIKGVYFSILTQAATIVFYNFFNGQQKLFNGTNGLQNFTTFLGANINDDKVQVMFYIITVIFVALAYGLCRWLTSGKFGRLLIAIRDDENRVRFSGYDSTNFKLLVFIISAILAGIAGALYTLQNKSISPRQMDIAFSIEMVIWVAVGGRASLTGAILGALLVNFAKTLLSEKFPEIWLFFQGGLFLIVVMVLPDGFVGWVRDNLDFMLSLVGIRQQVLTYPDIDLNPEVQFEKDVIEHQENNDQ
ncbi:MAG TPA: urea ABC transporter permease subunit UrtC, partial [Allocoleopsis sp.]